MIRKTIFFISVILVSCHSGNNVETLVNNLNSIHAQTDFLVEIGKLDQKVRIDETEILEKYGYDSKEHKKAWEIIRKTDDLNLMKIEAFFAKYGHPELEIHGTEAVNAPFLVIHHATGGLDPRIRNFKYMYEAFLKKDIDGGTFTFYLNRTYSTKFNERFKYDKPFSEGFEIDTLIKALELKPLALEIERKVAEGE
jgi:hypothetical protein